MSCFRIFFTVFLFVSMSLSEPVRAAYQFSEYSFSRNPARVDNQMRIQMTGKTALRSFRFVGRVGGVNFEAVVDLSGASFELMYDPSEPDGERAKMEIDGDLLTIPLYDWELLPIANYADSQYTAVVSILGEGPEPEKYRYINYHPALEDTHLGIRLLQADMMLINPMVFSEAPSEGEEKIYMPGESKEFSLEKRQAATSFIDFLMSQGNFQSWVFTDTDETPEIIVNKDQIDVKMQPYYYFWRQIDSSRIEKKIALIGKLREEVDRLEGMHKMAYSSYLSAPSGSSEEANALQQSSQLKLQLDSKIEQALALIGEVEDYEPEVQEVEDLTEVIRNNFAQVRLVAPFVYDAAEKTSDFAALFRGAKKEDQQEWSAFHAALKAQIDLPVVETPNQFVR